MNRAAILIGVNKTGNLPVLNDAVGGAKRMAQWALAQGIPEEQVYTLTDEQGPVEIGAVKRVVRKLVEVGNIDQLIIYFAGHGVNIRYGEYWLLSGAPVDSQAAVNVEGSIVLARQAGIPHVVMISDACRTSAEGIQAQFVSGSEIFPNDPVGGPEQAVDIFFASTLGKPSLEVQNPNDSANAYEALYTGVLLNELQGNNPTIVEQTCVDGDAIYVIHPRPLKKALQEEVTRRLIEFGLHAKVSQVPDARITSDIDAWLARVSEPAIVQTRTRSFGVTWGNTRPEARSMASLATLHTVSDNLLNEALGLGATYPKPVQTSNDNSLVIDGVELARGAQLGASTFGPTHFETHCGFKIRGAAVAKAMSGFAQTQILDSTGELVRVGNVEGPAASTLLVLRDGSSVILPAVEGFIAGLTFEEGELADVSYEPSDNTPLWQEYQLRRKELSTLRGVIASAARLGVFKLDGNNALELARRMQYSKSVDPSLALYAAYAYHDLQRRDLIGEMTNYLRGQLNMAFFDLGLLGGYLESNNRSADAGFSPCFPLLAQGWALLSAYRVSLPAELQGIQRYLMPSLWTQFTPEGTAILQQLMHSRVIK